MTNYRILFFLVSLPLLFSCTLGKSLRTEGASDSEVAGTYRVILYGCNYAKDLKTFAILDREDDRYTVDPYAPDFNYRVLKNVPAKEALKGAERFIQCNEGYRESQISKIVDPQGETLGYEIRPLYLAFFYGLTDVLETHYFLEGDKVVVTIRLRPSAKESEGGPEEKEHEGGR